MRLPKHITAHKDLTKMNYSCEFVILKSSLTGKCLAFALSDKPEWIQPPERLTTALEELEEGKGWEEDETVGCEVDFEQVA